MNTNRKSDYGMSPGSDQIRNHNDISTELDTDPLTALFADVKDADRVMRGLIAIGLDEDQIKMVSLESLLIEFNPEVVQQMTAKEGITTLSDLDSELIEGLGRRITDAIDLSQYLAAAGISETKAPYYTNKIRQRLILLIAKPEQENYAKVQRYLEEQRIKIA